ncbi:hypothetical protein OSTOST_10538, partial [Ostertagia ostertagi]
MTYIEHIVLVGERISHFEKVVQEFHVKLSLKWCEYNAWKSSFLSNTTSVKRKKAGSFGKVWTVECRKKPAQLFALKVPAPGFNPKHIAMELKVMRTISGGPNVVEFIAAYRELDRVFVVMNYFPHDDIFSLIHKIPLE